MAEPRAPADVRHVILPWARPEPLSGADAPPPQRVAAREQELRVSADRLIIRRSVEHADVAVEERAPGAPLLPPLLAHGLPFKPHPSIPDADRGALEQPALVSAAVALDLLATHLRRLPTDAQLLAGLTRALLTVGEAGGIDEHAISRLLGHARSAIGDSRATLSRQLTQVMAPIPTPGGEPAEVTAVGAALASTPRAVGRALARLVRGAEGVIREVLLRLQAEEPIDYKQA